MASIYSPQLGGTSPNVSHGTCPFFQYRHRGYTEPYRVFPEIRYGGEEWCASENVRKLERCTGISGGLLCNLVPIEQLQVEQLFYPISKNSSPYYTKVKYCNLF